MTQTTRQRLDSWAISVDVGRRLDAAADPSCPRAALAVLARDTEGDVLTLALNNPNLPVRVMGPALRSQ